jgi:hypothetical protein
MHSTDNLNDEYFGSGKIITASIKKHGKDKFIKEILEHLPSREALKLREETIVNAELINDALCMNLQIGGGGGFSNDAHQRRCSEVGKARFLEKLKDPEFAATYAKTHKISTRKRIDEACEEFGFWHNGFVGKRHSAESKAKIGKGNSLAQLGERNSQFGTKWMHFDKQNVKVKPHEVNDFLQRGFNFGRT